MNIYTDCTDIELIVWENRLVEAYIAGKEYALALLVNIGIEINKRGIR